MTTIQYKVNGSFPPFFVELREGSEVGTLVNSMVAQEANVVYEFNDVPEGSNYFIVVYDTAGGNDIDSTSPMFAMTMSVPPTTTTTTTVASIGEMIPITYSCSFNSLNTSNAYENIIDVESKVGTINTCYNPNTNTPNKFEIRQYSDNTLIASTPWVGEATYSGPWGFASMGSPYSCCPSGGILPFVITEQNYCLTVCTVTGPTFIDTYTWQIPNPV